MRAPDTSKRDRADSANGDSDDGEDEDLAPGKTGNRAADEDEHPDMQQNERPSFLAPEVVANRHFLKA